jgi:hypothetical protein
MGGNAKSHAMYMRYWTLLKKPPVPSLGKEVPDLEELIKKAVKDGRIKAKGEGRSVGGGGRQKKGTVAGTKRKPKVEENGDDSDEDIGSPAQKKHKPNTALAKKGAGVQLDQIEVEDSSEDAEGDTEGDI